MFFCVFQYVIDGLEAKGHETQKRPYGRYNVWPAITAIYSKCVPSVLGQSEACIEAVADWRKGGIPDGF